MAALDLIGKYDAFGRARGRMNSVLTSKDVKDRKYDNDRPTRLIKLAPDDI
jgi:hypothetical protein